MPLTIDERLLLGRIVRRSLAAALGGGEFRPVLEDGAGPALAERRGCFVTLKKDGALRGCLGCFVSETPLYLTVAAYARHSALDDRRFAANRLRLADLPLIDAEVSVLTRLSPCRDPEGIILGRHGIQVSRDGRSGCFLPQVATETGWSVEEFWGHCCRDKAGLAWDAWRRPGTVLSTFAAEVFDCPAELAAD
ncbi:MAG: AmmeMemoRadiSam system protein A [Planctomycetota bacterium]|jgi:AmmeMemoRadiSam system protein A|nr:AmmeMemoRadiSam system protein A [Planctomycetota bacterium]